uniref:Uncharacterized protein n=1 Tax=Micrurus paraensis TaxID=1970185 RepID=A0A2D4KQ50_9SAUR
MADYNCLGEEKEMELHLSACNNISFYYGLSWYGTELLNGTYTGSNSLHIRIYYFYYNYVILIFLLNCELPSHGFGSLFSAQKNPTSIPKTKKNLKKVQKHKKK